MYPMYIAYMNSYIKKKKINAHLHFHVPVTFHTHAHMKVLKRSQYLLLQTAYPDALVRLENSPLADQREELLSLYFQQHHSSLEDFMAYHLQRGGIQEESLLMQVRLTFTCQ